MLGIMTNTTMTSTVKLLTILIPFVNMDVVMNHESNAYN
jgi:hypothetical protein